MVETRKLAVFVTSFDGYSDLWDDFFRIFYNYWSDCPYNIYLSSNYKIYQNNDIITIRTGKEISWKDRMLKALNNISEEYVLVFLEDYLLGKKVHNNDIDEILKFMAKRNVNMYRIANIPKLKKNINTLANSSAIPILKDKRYSVNFQASIWNREHLIKIIKNQDGNTCWDFEYHFLKIADNANHEFYEDYFADNRDLFNIKNGVLKGKWIPSTLRYYKKKGILIDTKKRVVLSYLTYSRYCFISFFSAHIPLKVNKFIKKILINFGIKFISDI